MSHSQRDAERQADPVVREGLLSEAASEAAPGFENPLLVPAARKYCLGAVAKTLHLHGHGLDSYVVSHGDHHFQDTVGKAFEQQFQLRVQTPESSDVDIGNQDHLGRNPTCTYQH